MAKKQKQKSIISVTCTQLYASRPNSAFILWISFIYEIKQKHQFYNQIENEKRKLKTLNGIILWVS